MFVVTSNVPDLPDAWDEGPGFGQLSFQRGFLNAIQQCDKANAAHRYFLQQGAGGARAAAIGVELVRGSAANPLLDVALGRFASQMTSLRYLLPSTLLLKAPLSNDSPLECVGETTEARERVMDALLTELVNYVRSRGLALAITGVQDAHQELISLLQRRGFSSSASGATTVLDVGWTSWKEYVQCAGRTSRRASATIRREVNAASRAGLEFRRWDPEHEPAAPLHALLEGHWKRYSGTEASFPYTEHFLEQLQAGLGDRLHLLIVSRNGVAHGMVVFIIQGQTGYVTYMGVDEKGVETGFPYFNLAFYEPIRRAVELDVSSLLLGATAYAAKIKRGCQVRRTWLFVDPRWHSARWLMAPAFALHAYVMRRKHSDLMQTERFTNPG